MKKKDTEIERDEINEKGREEVKGKEKRKGESKEGKGKS